MLSRKIRQALTSLGKSSRAGDSQILGALSAASQAKTTLFAMSFALFATACSEQVEDNSNNPVETSGTVISPPAPSGISIRTVSAPSWLISGGDVLVEISSTDDSLDTLAISLNGEDITDQFVVTGNALSGLVDDLILGDSTLLVTVAGTDKAETLALSNYPATGPMISGPHQDPFHCQTEAFTLVDGGKLGPVTDENCSVQKSVSYVYWSATDSEFKPFRRSLTGVLPPDLGTMLNEAGAEVPLIVRVETGTVNRAIYESAMLHDPDEGEISPWVQSQGWNGKLVYTHGGGCRGGWFQQGDRTGGVLRLGLLEMGYAVTSSSLNVFGQNCNDLLASETHMMVKEEFIERYGEPIYTIGTGGSGGSYQSHQTADNYPGVFDGIIVSSSFPDVTSATIFTLADSRLLNYYFSTVDPEGFSPEQQQAITGFGALASMPNLSRGAARIDPIFYFDTAAEEQGGEVSIPALETRRYHPSIPRGVRATVYDHTVNVYGQTEDQKALRPLDNTGVQYGLQALNDELISFEQFIALNAGIGGFDRDANHIPERHRADEFAAKIAIESGRILNGGGGLAHTPIIDYRSYTDHSENGDIHMLVHQFSTRDRLINANGHADNHVMLVGGRWGFSEEMPDLKNLFVQMDEWLLALAGDTSERSPREKMRSAKPLGLVDSCWDDSSDTREQIAEPLGIDNNGRCAELYPIYSTPRHVAGAPLANDIVSCQLKPVSLADYRAEISAEQFSQLQDVFPQGVCDWSKGDASNARYQGTWKSFGPSTINLISGIPQPEANAVIISAQ